MKYKIEQLIDGEWWPFGTYRNAKGLAESAFFLGEHGCATEIKVTEVQE